MHRYTRKPSSRARAAESSISAPSIRFVPYDNTPVDAETRVLTEQEREALAAIATSAQLAPRTILYREHAPADAVYVIARGVMKSFRELPSGKQRITAFLFPQDLFGLAENGQYVNATQAVTKVVLHRLPLGPLVDILHGDPYLQHKVLAKVTDALRESQRHNIVVGRRDAHGRLAMFLRLLKEQTQRRGGVDIDIPMSRADAANFLGLSPEAVSRASRKLELAGIIEFRGRHSARILNPTQFDKLVAAM